MIVTLTFLIDMEVFRGQLNKEPLRNLLFFFKKHIHLKNYIHLFFTLYSQHGFCSKFSENRLFPNNK